MNLAYVSLFPILGLPVKEWKRQSARECKEEKQNTDTLKETERKRDTEKHTHAGKSCFKRNVWRNKAVLWRKS